MLEEAGAWKLTITNSEVTIEAFGQTATLRQSGGSTMWDVAATALQGTGFNLTDIRAQDRSLSVCAARRGVVHALRASGCSLNVIARFIGRNRSTILHTLEVAVRAGTAKAA